MVEKFRTKVVSLDGLFKLNKLRFPLYTLGVTDERGHTWPITVTSSSLSKHGEIMHFLSMVHTKIESELDIIWAGIYSFPVTHTCWEVHTLYLSYIHSKAMTRTQEAQNLPGSMGMRFAPTCQCLRDDHSALRSAAHSVLWQPESWQEWCGPKAWWVTQGGWHPLSMLVSLFVCCC